MTKVLLAEDDVNMLYLLKTLLNLDGFQVATLDIAKEDVVKTLRKEKPDVLTLEFQVADTIALLRIK